MQSSRPLQPLFVGKQCNNPCLFDNNQDNLYLHLCVCLRHPENCITEERNTHSSCRDRRVKAARCLLHRTPPPLFWQFLSKLILKVPFLILVRCGTLWCLMPCVIIIIYLLFFFLKGTFCDTNPEENINRNNSKQSCVGFDAQWINCPDLLHIHESCIKIPKNLIISSAGADKIEL